MNIFYKVFIHNYAHIYVCAITDYNVHLSACFYFNYIQYSARKKENGGYAMHCKVVTAVLEGLTLSTLDSLFVQHQMAQ